MKLGGTIRNLVGGFAHKNRNGTHRFEVAAKKPRQWFGAKKTEGRLIKCKLERKMTAVIYRHKFAIHRVSSVLNEQE